MRFATNRKTLNAEFKSRSDFRQCGLRTSAAGKAVGDDANVMTALGLAIGEVQDVTKDAADRRAHGVQDA